MSKNVDTSPRQSASDEADSLFAWPQFGLEYTVEPCDDAPDRYTFYPGGASDEEIITTWISAAEESVVDITEIR
jgi:hypothetical protein